MNRTHQVIGTCAAHISLNLSSRGSEVELIFCNHINLTVLFYYEILIISSSSLNKTLPSPYPTTKKNHNRTTKGRIQIQSNPKLISGKKLSRLLIKRYSSGGTGFSVCYLTIFLIGSPTLICPQSDF